VAPEPPPPVVKELSPPPTPVQAPAVLLISSPRRGVVYVNGKNVGTVKPGEPLRVDVQTGDTLVRFTPSGGKSMTKKVNVSEGDSFELEF
jgi:hypothetical protein